MKNARHMHLRDAVSAQMQTEFGMGIVDFVWVLTILKNLGYSGNVSIEYLETDRFDVLNSSRKLYDKIAEYLPI